ncbi:MAG: FtsX-like permease family protein [Rhodospirillaceae bacterium]|jgi:cell division transport system permease protein|nr:FtsX-like permease family protein [Rhodospirillaceae bacterium]MBT4589981.1 FtsX-like permease family protein [Rhodospirillaceae bacterium]MBT4940841.1 FtsX-like permease family protein [Rhodospirillaceae bacterium]MBT5940770.1 FtsX-like permease family protein [Rhodospirillaceae bacterium]MBT7265305.1 FtsX-like permease family protein [Rhodospirillaceae bacterium]
MRFRQSKLALEKDDSNRFLPWIIAFMVLLATLSVAGMLMLNQISNVFEHSIHDTMTVQIPAAENTIADERHANEALAALKKVGGVIASKRVPNGEVRKLLQPWLGETAGSEGLPLPQIIDVEVDRSADLTAEKLTTLLTPIMPGTTVDDHSVWLTSLVDTLRSAELIALAIVFLITLATMGTVVFTTRTGMGIHRQTIEVLHFVGAQDEFIARQFATRAFIVGLQGGIVGILLAAPILYLFDYVLKNLEEGLLPKASLDISIWISVGFIVPVVAFVAMMTARSTVLKTLKKIV